MSKPDNLGESEKVGDEFVRDSYYILTGSQIEKIAELAATKASAKVTHKVVDLSLERSGVKFKEMLFLEIGRGVFNRLFWIIGVLAVAAYTWAKSKGLVS